LLGQIGREIRNATAGDASAAIANPEFAAHLVRVLLFNGAVVRGMWEPLIRAAEQKRGVARLMNSQLYRGVMFYHFLCGCHDGYRRFDRRGVGPAQADHIRVVRPADSQRLPDQDAAPVDLSAAAQAEPSALPTRC